ncbi:MAG: hypothetical protein EOM14_10830 [Clostridia bacterium]|nr:hypothetical protein [Clostridia bacterium]
MSGVFDGIWQFGREMTAVSSDGEESVFRGFLEPMSLTDAKTFLHSPAGAICKEQFRLLAEPAATALCGDAAQVICGKSTFAVLAVKELFYSGEVSHRQCVLVRKGEVTGNA